VKVFGFPVPFTQKSVTGTSSVTAQNASAVYGMMSWLSGIVRESFAGAWQRNIVPESKQNLLAFSAVYACITLIADDISKLRIKLVAQDSAGVWSEVDNASFSPVLRKPNRYQTRIQFLSEWITSLLLHGNAYILKERDNRNIVTDLYVLNPTCVTPLVAEDGSVYYKLKSNYLAGVMNDEITVPADEIIHDRAATLWHPLVGVSPIFACAASATQGIRIQNNSAVFFENMSRPSGQLTSPNKIDDITAARLKADFEQRFGGGNLGRIMVAGNGLKYEPMGTIPANDAQLIEQLGWTVEDVARCFKVPLHKISSQNAPAFNNIEALNQDYYSQCLQTRIEAIELLLDEGLGIGSEFGGPVRNLGTELDLDGLLRMDSVARAQANKDAITAGYLTPNEARLRDNLPPVKGGDTPYMQQQNWPLAQLADRPTPSQQPPAPPAPNEPPASANPPNDSKPPANTPPPATAPGKDAHDFARVFLERLMDPPRVA
jgi:HK97 family phage portal protein